MKTSLQLLVAILIITVANLLNISSSFGQSPEKMSYQAVIRDANGQLLTSQSVSMQFSILQGSTNGTAVYIETHSVTSNDNGMISLNIGNGNVISGNFATIDWSNGSYFIKTETDPTGGNNYTISGTNQLLSVPYALHAKTAETFSGTINETDPVFTISQAANITSSDISKLANLSGTNTGDQDLSALISTEEDPVFMASPFGNLSQTDIDEWNNKLNEFIESDPLFAASLANGITTTDTAYWNSKLDEFIETDPTFLAHPSAGITEEDITKWSALWIWYTTNEKGYISTETDPIFETSIAKGITAVDTAAWNNSGGALEIDDLSDAKTDVGSIFLGSGAGANDDGTNKQNVAVGIDALKANTSGNSNTANGFRALYSNTTGSYNTANGRMTLYSNNGYNNTANGYNALNANTIGNFNTANGSAALYYNTSGSSNTANGSAALYQNRTGSYNTASGYRSLIFNASGSNNTAIGYEAGNLNTSGSGNIFLGKQAGYNETGSDKLYIENSNSTTPLIYGDFAADSLRINGSFVAASAASEVTGSFLSTSTGGQTAILNIIAGGSANPTNIVHIIDSSGDDPNLLKVDGPSANEFIITNAGNVGIGTITPTANLHVYSTSDTRIRSEGVDPRFDLFGANHWHMQSVDANGRFRVFDETTGAERLSILTNGNVGVNTATPDATLHIDGSLKMVDGKQAAGRVLTSDANGLASWQNKSWDSTYASIKNTPVLTAYATKDMANAKITNLADPTASQDAATKAYVDLLKGQIEELQLLAGIRVKDADGNVYDMVTIGTQTWMTENLKTTKYNDGTDIPYLPNSADYLNPLPSTPAYTWYNNDEATYKSTYGALYSYFTVATTKLCPTGWHVPSDAEWTTLTTYLGGLSIAGGKLKESGAVHWISGNTSDNSSGFTGLPGGYRYYNGGGGFLSINQSGSHWSSTVKAAGTAWKYILQSGDGFGTSDKEVKRYSGNMPDCFSVRCIKD